jgi:hypothetical protein
MNILNYGIFSQGGSTPSVVLPYCQMIPPPPPPGEFPASLGVEIYDIDNGGGVITERGVCWLIGTSQPSTSDFTDFDNIDSESTITFTMTDIQANTTYTFSGYITNSVGTYYTPPGQFTTGGGFD